MKTNQISQSLFTSNGYTIEECLYVINFIEHHCPPNLIEDLKYNSESTTHPSLLLKVQPKFMIALNDICYELDKYETTKTKLTPLINEQPDPEIKALLQNTLNEYKPSIDVSGHSLKVFLKYLIRNTDYMELPYDFFWYSVNCEPFANAVKDCYNLIANNPLPISHSDKYTMQYWTHIFKA